MVSCKYHLDSGIKLKSSALTLRPLLAAAPAHFYRFCDKNLPLLLPSFPLDLHEQNGLLRETLAIGICLAFAQSSVPYPTYPCQQVEAAFRPLHPGTFDLDRQTSLPNKAVWLRGRFARSIDEKHLQHHGEEEMGQRYVQMYYCGLCENVYL